MIHATKDHVHNITSILLGVAFVFLILFIVSSGQQQQDIDNLKFIIVAEYNFSESDCVKADSVHWQERDDSPEGCTVYVNWNSPLPSDTCLFRFVVDECSLYCKTYQIPLKNETTNEQLQDCKTNFVLANDGKTILNRTTCTPKFKIVQGNCKTAESVNRARGLVI